MASKKYIEQSKNLIRAIDIALEVIKTNPPKEFEGQQKYIQMFLETYNGWKEQLIKPDPKYMTIASLKYDIDTVFTYFQESSGETVNEFWKKILN